ncbi:hypothetical protein D9M68_787580 [compost metagenome]
MQHFIVLVQHHHRARGNASQRAAAHGHAVILEEFRATHGRQVDHVFQAFGATETRLGERQVGRHAEHHGVFQFAGFGIELAHRGSAGRGVNAGENIQHFAFAGQAAQADIGQTRADQGERRGLLAGLRQLAVDLYRIAFEGYLRHELCPFLQS